MAANSPVDHFSCFSKIEPLKGFPDHIVHTVFIALILLALSIWTHMQIKKSAKDVIPDRKLTFKTVFELYTEFILNMLRGIMPKDAEKYLPLVGSIFLFIFLCNFIGLIPGFQPPTADLNLNLAIAATVFIYYNYQGIRANGLGYIKHFLGPMLGIAFLMLPIELISHMVRPVSLSLRLFGNMTGDHMVLNIFSNLTFPYSFGVPLIFMALGLLVCLIQAFVFTLLSIVYISMATAHDH
jgi:F-type H+-transporting ATPase subunit a